MRHSFTVESYYHRDETEADSIKQWGSSRNYLIWELFVCIVKSHAQTKRDYSQSASTTELRKQRYRSLVLSMISHTNGNKTALRKIASLIRWANLKPYLISWKVAVNIRLQNLSMTVLRTQIKGYSRCKCSIWSQLLLMVFGHQKLEIRAW